MFENFRKKAIVVGGSNGIGLAIAQQMINIGYHVVIVDKGEPDKSAYLDSNRYSFIKTDLLDFDTKIFTDLAQDDDVEVLMITAGFGRVADFEHLHLIEIENVLKVNTTASIKIIKCFYERINNSVPFYCGIMGSIAGMVSSPRFSVYAASKAGVCRFVESVNIELVQAGCNNRILNVSPGSIKGSSFNGGKTNLQLMEMLAEEIAEHLFNSSDLFIPDYDEVYKDVLERYQVDAHNFGISSYQYKKESGRVLNKKHVKIGYLSGTFDLFHVGHLNLIKSAKEQCEYLIVGVHPNATHKGKETFIPFEERKAIVNAIKYVDEVAQSFPEDCDAWDIHHYDKLFVGSDYKGTDRFNYYEEYFQDKGVEIVYFPYTKGTSSTQIRNVMLSKSEK